jgi:hypothetical protein
MVGSKRRVLVGGALANKHLNGGAAWTRLSWVLGFQRLGFDVCFVEQIEPESCVDAAGAATDFASSANLAFFRDVTARFGLSGRSALICGEHTDGLSLAEVRDVTAEADLLVNISGHLRLDAALRRVRRKAYLDLDPGFTQLWHAHGNMGARLAGHDFYFTVGENIGTSACQIPTSGIRWRPTRQPVVLEDWPVSTAGSPDRFTTVASWRGPYGRVEHDGRVYGLKVHEFRRFVQLPERAAGTFEIALDIHPADRGDLDALRCHRWRVVAPRAVVPDPDAFRDYVQQSSAEFSVAQGVYVETNSGWFSDRTVRYLASGKPVLVQDTGFSRTYPVGQGLVAFRTLDEAVAGSERIALDYAEHGRAARALAEAYFNSDAVLGQLVDEIGIAP